MLSSSIHITPFVSPKCVDFEQTHSVSFH